MRALRASASLLLVLLFAFVPAAEAQRAEDLGGLTRINVNVEPTYITIPYLGQVDLAASISDLSRDAAAEARGSESGILHQVAIDVKVFPYGAPSAANETVNATTNATPGIRGWAAAGGGTVFTSSGKTVPFTLQVKNGGDVYPNYVTVRVSASTRDYYSGTMITDEQDILVQLEPFYAGRLLIKAPPQTVGQNAIAQIPVEVSNFNTYRDTFTLNATAPAGFVATVTPRILLEPRETRIVYAEVVTPHNKVIDLGTPATVFVNMRSENDPKVVYTAATQIIVSGPYVPPYWWPVFLLGVVAAVVVGRDTRERAILRRGEKNLPRRPRPSPREAALLAELRRRDRDAWKARVTGYDELYGERRKVWKEHRREELAEERAEKRESHRLAKERRAKENELSAKRREIEKAKAKRDAAAQAVAAKEAAARAKADKREAKLGAKLQKKQAKIDAKRAKVEAKERAKLEKALAKKRKELEALAKKKAKELERERKKGG